MLKPESDPDWNNTFLFRHKDFDVIAQKTYCRIKKTEQVKNMTQTEYEGTYGAPGDSFQIFCTLSVLSWIIARHGEHGLRPAWNVPWRGKCKANTLATSNVCMGQENKDTSFIFGM